MKGCPGFSADACTNGYCPDCFRTHKDTTQSNRCIKCIELSPYDLTIQKDNCTFQAHTELMNNKQLKRVFKLFGNN